MTAEYTARATKSVLNSKKGFCKFLSANDTGATGGHQSGILISKSAIDMMFNRQELEQNTIPKRTVKIRWQDDFETVSRFTFYESKNELRITFTSNTDKPIKLDIGCSLRDIVAPNLFKRFRTNLFQRWKTAISYI